MSEHDIEFEWSEVKAEKNLKKHGVSFDEAETAFGDSFALIVDDIRHSDHEMREILIGYSDANRLLFISFVELGHSRIRIISARLADRKERRDYEEEKRF